MKVAIASPPYPKSVADGLHWIEKLVKDAAGSRAEIICFPESYVPGYPLNEKHERKTPQELQSALDKVCETAAANSIAVIMPMDWYGEDQFLNVAQVISASGEVLGYQAKNQLDPSEDKIWDAGSGRNIYEINDVKIGIAICHEGFRYPETVRWAARNGAQIVFHPHFAGSDIEGTVPEEWGNMANPYYEKAMMMRAIENTIYFASSNYATRFPESASSLIAPDGKCVAHAAYGEPGVLVEDIDISLATGYLARRLRHQLYYE